MARYAGPVCRLCRREGMKLFLKGERCYAEKCAIEKRNVPPGQQSRRRRPNKVMGYGSQLREKQKVKRTYGVLESQFRRYFAAAERQRGIPGATLRGRLERRRALAEAVRQHRRDAPQERRERRLALPVGEGAEGAQVQVAAQRAAGVPRLVRVLR